MHDEDEEPIPPEIEERLEHIAAELEFRNYLHDLWEKEKQTGWLKQQARERRPLEQALLDPPEEWGLRPLSPLARKLLLDEWDRVGALP